MVIGNVGKKNAKEEKKSFSLYHDHSAENGVKEKLFIAEMNTLHHAKSMKATSFCVMQQQQQQQHQNRKKA